MAIAAVNRGNRSQFVQLMAQRGVWVIVRLDQGEFAGDIRLLEYEEGDRFVLPVFSSLFEAMAFVYTVELGEMSLATYVGVLLNLVLPSKRAGAPEELGAVAAAPEV